MLRDAEFFRSRLGKLEGAGDIGDYVVSVVNEKSGSTLNEHNSGAQAAAQTTQVENDDGGSKT